MIINKEKILKAFETENCMAVDSLLDDNILNFLKSVFKEENLTTQKVLNESSLEKNLCNEKIKLKLSIIFNTKNFISFGSKLFKKNVVGCIQRVYIQDKYSKGLTWHDDRKDGRRVGAIRIELSDNEYLGGAFLYRERETLKTKEFTRSQFGNAVIFRLEDHFEHMVESVEGDGTRKSIVIFFIEKD